MKNYIDKLHYLDKKELKAEQTELCKCVKAFMGCSQPKKLEHIKFSASNFKKLVTAHFAPNIRKLGFKGTGFLYRKINEHYTNVIQFESYRRLGGAVRMLLGVYFQHIDFDEVSITERLPVNKVRVCDCDICFFLSPHDFGQWWTYAETLEGNRDVIYKIWNMFLLVGLPFFDEFENYPKPFTQISLNDLKNVDTSKLWRRYDVPFMHLLYIIIQVELEQGNQTKAKMIADYALSLLEKNKMDNVFHNKLCSIIQENNSNIIEK